MSNGRAEKARRLGRSDAGAVAEGGTAPAQRKRAGRGGLPAALRQELDERLAVGNIGDCAALQQYLAARGWMIAPAPPAGNNLERRLELVKLATRQARQVMRGAKCDSAAMSEALLRLMQQHLFGVLVELEPSGPGGVKLEAIARMVAQLARASLLSRKHMEELRERLRGANGENAAEAADGVKEISDERLRELLLEMTRGDAGGEGAR